MESISNKSKFNYIFTNGILKVGLGGTAVFLVLIFFVDYFSEKVTYFQLPLSELTMRILIRFIIFSIVGIFIYNSAWNKMKKSYSGESE